MRPYTIQPFSIFPYIGRTRHEWPADIATEMYLSFEDALWDVLPRLGYKKNAKILVPSFYCIDVVNNMIEHGYSVAFYPLKKDLSFDLQAILSVIEKEDPDIFIEFHVDGIRNSLLKEVERKLHPRILIISDRVHSIMVPNDEFIPHSDRHLYIGSFRKVSALPGTLVVFTRNARKRDKSALYPWGYMLYSLWLWGIYITMVKSAHIFRSRSIGKWAKQFLVRHNDLIGDAVHSAHFYRRMKRLYEYFDIEKISYAKREQIFIYEKYLIDFINDNNNVWLPANIEDSYDVLRAYPLIVASEKAEQFVKALEIQGIYSSLQLEAAPWCKQQKLFFFPLGPHISKNDIEEVAKRIKIALTNIR